MSDWLPLLIGGAAGLFVLDRALRWMESRGWIYYRKGSGRGAIGYHMLEMSSVFDPGFKAVQEIQVSEEKREDEAGDPLGPDAYDGGEDVTPEEALRRHQAEKAE